MFIKKKCRNIIPSSQRQKTVTSEQTMNTAINKNAAEKPKKSTEVTKAKKNTEVKTNSEGGNDSNLQRKNTPLCCFD